MKRASVRVMFLTAASAVLGLLLSSPLAEAQITVPPSTLPVAGDTLKMAIDAEPLSCSFLVFTAPGGPQNWDLGCLRADRTQDIVYRQTTVGSVPGAFPGVTTVVLLGILPPFLPDFMTPVETYYKSTGTELQYMGAYGMAPGRTTPTLLRFFPNFAERRAPRNFFDINQTSTGLLEAFDGPEMDASIRALLPFTADSFRYRIAISRFDAVDAYGTVKLPGGDFEVLREKRTQYTEKRIDAKVAPLGWLDVTDIFIQYVGWNWLGVDTLVSYHFYDNASKEPIAIVDLDRDQATPVRAYYKNVQPVCQNDGDPCGDQSSSACNLPDTCQAGVCVSNLLAAGTACGSGTSNACTSPDTCDGNGACVANDKPNGTACSDSNACTSGDSCQNGTCTVGAPVTCNDNNSCTNDSCNPATGCVFEPNNTCTPAISVVGAVQQVESCSPTNGVLDPDERVTYAITLRNNGTQPTTKLVATLLASADVSAPSGKQTYGVIPAGGTATKSFTWTGVGACGAAWAASLALTDNGQAVPGVTVTGSYGTPGGVCNTGCAVVRLTTKSKLTRNTDGTVKAVVTISNTGSVQATNVSLTSALLGTTGGTPLPQAVGTIAAGSSKNVTVTFPASVVAGGSVVRVSGTYTGGTFSTSLRVTVP